MALKNGVWLGMFLGLAIQVGAGSAAAASVRGRITGQQHLRNPVWTTAKLAEKHGYSFREPVPTVPARFRKLFPDITREICIVAFSSEAVGQRSKERVVRVAGGRTSSVTLVVRPGAKLRFTNGDSFQHRLFGVGNSSFSPAPLERGKSRKWTVKSPGIYEIADEASPSLHMWVVAKSGVAAIAYPSRTGVFSLELKKPGDYTLQAYFSGRAIGKARRVKVGRRKVNLTKRPLVLATKAPKEKGSR